MRGQRLYGAAVWFIVAAFFGIVVWENGTAHVPRQRLFYTLAVSVASDPAGVPPVNFEQAAGKSVGSVLKINGQKAFNQYVVRRSGSVPVVLKVCSDHNEDSKKEVHEFQAIAEKFDGRVSCVALDLFAFHENYNIVSQLMMRENILKLELPLFMFFKDGALYRTDGAPVAILQGFHTRDNLEQFITKKFFK